MYYASNDYNIICVLSFSNVHAMQLSTQYVWYTRDASYLLISDGTRNRPCQYLHTSISLS